MNWMPVRLLAILAIPAFVIVLVEPTLRSSLLATFGIGFVIAALIVIAQAATTTPTPGPPSERVNRLDEATLERQQTLVSYGATAFVGGTSMLVALVSSLSAVAMLLLVAAWVVTWWPFAMRHFTLTSTVVIERDPATVFAFVSDLRNVPRFYYMFDETIEKIGDGPIAVGTEFRTHVILHKGDAPRLDRDYVFDGTEEIVLYDPNRELAIRVSSGLDPNLATFTFEEDPAGTRVTHRFEHLQSYSSGFMGVIVTAGPTRRVMRLNREKAWQRAKQILESDTA